jgi:hypothetical protein
MEGEEGRGEGKRWRVRKRGGEEKGEEGMCEGKKWKKNSEIERKTLVTDGWR